MTCTRPARALTRATRMQAVVKQLKRAQGQIGGILAMSGDGREFQEVVTQLPAVPKALDGAGLAVSAIGRSSVSPTPGPAPWT